MCNPRYDDPLFRMAFARLVTHYWHHAAWLEDGALLRDAGRLAGIPGVLVHGRIDPSGPLDIAWLLSQAWSGSELVVIDDAGHGFDHPGMSDALITATDRFARRPSRTTDSCGQGNTVSSRYHGPMSAVQLQPVGLEDKAVLGRLLELYLYDFSEFTGADLNEHALYGYPYLDHYWTEPDRHPFFLRVAGGLAGFAMVRRLDGGVWSMAEFCVLRKYRRRGVGRAAAHQVISRFPGSWEVRHMTSNESAAAFWPRVIDELVPGAATRHDEPGWVVQTFEIRGS